MQVTKSLITKLALAINGIISFYTLYSAANSFVYSITVGSPYFSARVN